MEFIRPARRVKKLEEKEEFNGSTRTVKTCSPPFTRVSCCSRKAKGSAEKGRGLGTGRPSQECKDKGKDGEREDSSDYRNNTSA